MKAQIKRIAAVHDLCGYGKCSLNIAIPVISAAGHEVNAIPTGIFSMHTAMKNWNMIDTSSALDDYINSWKKEGVCIDAVYSGFLCNKAQIYSILQLYANYPQSIKFVDPVMGDNGKLYKTYNDELCNEIKKIIAYADFVTPNLTEAYKLTNQKYNCSPNEEEINNLLYGIKKLGAKNIVLTGVVEGNFIKNYVLDNNQNIYHTKTKYFKHQIHGSGDLFCSCLLAHIMNGKNLIDAINLSGKFMHDAIKLTLNQKGYENRGISFEPLLNKLNSYKRKSWLKKRIKMLK